MISVNFRKNDPAFPRLLAKKLNDLQSNIVEVNNHLNGIIDDENVRLDATYSSQKIMELVAEFGFTIKVVDTLPARGRKNTLYFVPASEEVHEYRLIEYSDQYVITDDVSTPIPEYVIGDIIKPTHENSGSNDYIIFSSVDKERFVLDDEFFGVTETITWQKDHYYEITDIVEFKDREGNNCGKAFIFEEYDGTPDLFVECEKIPGCFLYKQEPSQDIKDEYIWVNSQWEKIGSTRIDLSQYYTKAETNSLLAGKSNVGHTHTKSEITDFAHTHAISDVTGLQTALDGKVSTTTTIAGVNLQDNITKAELLTALNVEDGADDNVIESITVNGNSATIDASTKTASVTIPEASQSASGVMSSADKTKLDNLETIKGIKSNEKIVSLTQDTDLLQTTLSIAIEQGSAGTADEGKTFIRLKGIGGAEVSSVDASSFVIDGMLQSAEIYSYDGTTWTPSTPTGGTVPSTAGVYIRLAWNSDAGGQVSYLDVSTLIDAYTAGNGLELSVNNVFSIKIDSTPGNVTLTTSANGLKASVDLSGKQDTLTAGTNISINSSNNISVLGYNYNVSNGAFGQYNAAHDSDPTTKGDNSALGQNSAVFGQANTVSATGEAGFIGGGQANTVSGGASAVIGGYNNTVNGDYAFATGEANTVSGEHAFAEGSWNNSAGNSTHAEGNHTTAQNITEHAEGSCNVSHKSSSTYGNAGNTQHSVGIGPNIGNYKNAHEIMQNGDQYIIGIGGYDGIHIKTETGYENTKTLQEVVNSKQETLTAGTNISINNNTVSAKGYVFDDTKESFAEGNNVNTASGNKSHAEGLNTETTNEAEHAEGKFNQSNIGKTIHSIGIGTADDDRKNAVEVLGDGKVYIHGIGGYDGTNPDTAEDVNTIVGDVNSALQIIIGHNS